MKGHSHTTMVSGIGFEYWGDIIERGTFAKNISTGEIKRIHGSGYLTKDLSVRKAIAISFGLPTFRTFWKGERA